MVAEGEIGDGEAPPGRIGGLSTAALIRKAREDEQVKALVLRVDSPGGSAFGCRADPARAGADARRRQAGGGVDGRRGGLGRLLDRHGRRRGHCRRRPPSPARSACSRCCPPPRRRWTSCGVHTGGVTTTWLGGAYDPRRATRPALRRAGAEQRRPHLRRLHRQGGAGAQAHARRRSTRWRRAGCGPARRRWSAAWSTAWAATAMRCRRRRSAASCPAPRQRRLPHHLPGARTRAAAAVAGAARRLGARSAGRPAARLVATTQACRCRRRARCSTNWSGWPTCRSSAGPMRWRCTACAATPDAVLRARRSGPRAQAAEHRWQHRELAHQGADELGTGLGAHAADLQAHGGQAHAMPPRHLARMQFFAQPGQRTCLGRRQARGSRRSPARPAALRLRASGRGGVAAADGRVRPHHPGCGSVGRAATGLLVARTGAVLASAAASVAGGDAQLGSARGGPTYDPASQPGPCPQHAPARVLRRRVAAARCPRLGHRRRLCRGLPGHVPRRPAAASSSTAPAWRCSAPLP